MDESNATRVSAQPVEVAERSDGYPPQTLHVSLRLDTKLSANALCGLLFDVLTRRGNVVDAIRINKSERPLAKYERPKDGR